jgi:hypothetical protein
MVMFKPNFSLAYVLAGDYLLFTARVYVDCPDLNCTAQRDAEIAARGSNTGFIFTKLYVTFPMAYLTLIT